MARSNISSKYKDIISKCTTISSGCPAVYQLKPKKKKIDSLTKISFGEKTNKLNKVILLVGETGTGKSTLINSLVSYAMGVTWEDEIFFQIVEDEKKCQSESQTSDVIVYEIFGFEGKPLPFSLTIIDTPGYGDTRGTDQDAIVSKRLFELFRLDDGIKNINAVGLVLKAAENRISDRMEYIFDSLMSLFGKDMTDKIAALITHSDGVSSANVLNVLKKAKIMCAKNDKNEPLHFLFNNCQTACRTEGDGSVLQLTQMITNRGMVQFTEFLKNSPPLSVEKTMNVIKQQLRLTASIQNLQDRIRMNELRQKEVTQARDALRKYESDQEMKKKIMLMKLSEVKSAMEEKQKEIENAQEDVKKYEKEIEKSKNFTVEVDEPYKDKEPIKGGWWVLTCYEGAVCCKVCEENCHYPGCTVAWSPKSCEVMKDGYCTSCTGKCSASHHVKEEWIYVTKTRKVKRTIEELKKKYEENLAEESKKVSQLKNLKGEISNLTEVIDKEKHTIAEAYEEQEKCKMEKITDLRQMEIYLERMEEEMSMLLEEAYESAIILDQISLNENSASFHVHLDLVIQRMELINTTKALKLKEIRSKSSEEKRNKIWRYFFKK